MSFLFNIAEESDWLYDAWTTVFVEAHLIRLGARFDEDIRAFDRDWPSVVASTILETHAPVDQAFGAEDARFVAVPEGSHVCGAIVITADSVPVAFIDDGAGLPITPIGGDIVIAWDKGASKIFRLTQENPR